MLFEKSVMVAVATGQGVIVTSVRIFTFCLQHTPAHTFTSYIYLFFSLPKGAGQEDVDVQPLPMLILIPRVAFPLLLCEKTELNSVFCCSGAIGQEVLAY
jgi:hypothetical protein